MKLLTLREAMNICKLIKEHDYNDEHEVYIKNGRIIVENKLITIEPKLNYLMTGDK